MPFFFLQDLILLVATPLTQYFQVVLSGFEILIATVTDTDLLSK